MRAGDLAEWAMARLVNRTDVWGGYVQLADRGKKYTDAAGQPAVLGASLTKPAKSRRGKEHLTQQILIRHFQARGPEDVIGLHTTSPENTSKWGGPEIDWHGLQSTGPQVNLEAAIGWYSKLTRLGFRPLLTDSNGKGGYHLLALFSEPVQTAKVYAFLTWLVSDHVKYGLPNPPEIFPKQPRIETYGNWLRVPGRHHTRPHWSRVWDGNRWLEGHQAIDLMLLLDGDSPRLIPGAAASYRFQRRPERQCQIPSAVPVVADNRLTERIQHYANQLPHLGEGEGRHRVAYRFAAYMVRDWQVPDSEALTWLESWDAGNRPPLGADELGRIMADARRYGRHAYGSGAARAQERSWNRKHGDIVQISLEV
jgi:hypothetical protein